MLPDLSDMTATDVVAATAGIGAVVWHFWLRLRTDNRADIAGHTTSAAYRELLATQEARINVLETRCAALESRLLEMNETVRLAIDSKYFAERESMHKQAEVRAAQAANADLLVENNTLRAQLSALRMGGET